MSKNINEQYVPPNITDSVILRSTDGTKPPRIFDVVLGVPPPPPINFIFNDNDKVRKQTATDITFIFGEPIPPNCSPIRNGNSNKFDFRCAPILSDSNNFKVLFDYASAEFLVI